MRVTKNELIEFLKTNPKPDIDEQYGHSCDEETPWFGLHETTDEFRAYLVEIAEFVETNDAYEFQPMMLHIVFGLSHAISAEYDSDFHILWDAFKLGGDDDVDYCGSYVMAMVEYLQAYCDAKGVSNY